MRVRDGWGAPESPGLLGRRARAVTSRPWLLRTGCIRGEKSALRVRRRTFEGSGAPGWAELDISFVVFLWEVARRASANAAGRG